MNETITITREQLEKIFTIWCIESKENPDLFESIDSLNLNQMTVDEINDYAKSCADYLIRKSSEV